ncbi:hypothetical protein JKP88DRAFT_275817 [Tribonema minus]|uniref:Uncharacterized protein n=1 Tax=Tribonema minus TaxID=303371 RepID=A0A835Z9Y1_9STRA|nr:hypothetical protein JKP88DRAFT_275817 [Tribonema minus]
MELMWITAQRTPQALTQSQAVTEQARAIAAAEAEQLCVHAVTDLNALHARATLDAKLHAARRQQRGRRRRRGRLRRRGSGDGLDEFKLKCEADIMTARIAADATLEDFKLKCEADAAALRAECAAALERQRRNDAAARIGGGGGDAGAGAGGGGEAAAEVAAVRAALSVAERCAEREKLSVDISDADDDSYFSSNGGRDDDFGGTAAAAVWTSLASTMLGGGCGGSGGGGGGGGGSGSGSGGSSGGDSGSGAARYCASRLPPLRKSLGALPSPPSAPASSRKGRCFNTRGRQRVICAGVPASPRFSNGGGGGGGGSGGSKRHSKGLAAQHERQAGLARTAAHTSPSATAAWQQRRQQRRSGGGGSRGELYGAHRDSASAMDFAEGGSDGDGGVGGSAVVAAAAEADLSAGRKPEACWERLKPFPPAGAAAAALSDAAAVEAELSIAQLESGSQVTLVRPSSAARAATAAALRASTAAAAATVAAAVTPERRGLGVPILLL